MPTQLPLDALEMALWTRARTGENIVGLIHHSDAGSQYTSLQYSERLLTRERSPRSAPSVIRTTMPRPKA